jgi:DNA-binding NtrC family response regulator
MTYRVLVVDDDQFQAKTVQLAIEKMLKYDVITCNSGSAAIDLLLTDDGEKIDLVILDLSMPEVDGIEVLDKVCPHRPDLPIIINTAFGDIKKAVSAIQKGAIDFIEKKDGPDRLKVSIENVRLINKLSREVKKLHRFSNNKFNFKDIIGESDSIKKAINAAQKAAKSNIPVLLHGESGVGKELFARAIHAESVRVNKSFVAVNCGAIPQNLVESVLFGHEKGSFTGAVEKSIGKFREADGGTIFLDEVAELPMESQTKLLRVLQNFEVEPVGGTKPIDINIRILSATNKNLEKAVAEGKFREDLYYRLNAFQIEIPSLRQRKEDISLLAKHFVEKICVREKKNILTIDDSLTNMLKEYWWPGNIRQLENSIYRAVVLSNGDSLNIYDFENILSSISGNKNIPAGTITNNIPDNIGYTNFTESKFKTISEHEKDIIERALEFYNYNISKVSKVLDVGRSTLYRKMKEYNIEMKGSLEELEEFKKTKNV